MAHHFICDCGERYSSSALVIACADRNHGNPRPNPNRAKLRKIIEELGHGKLTEQALTELITRIVRDAEAGRLGHHDSLILGAFAVSSMRDCV